MGTYYIDRVQHKMVMVISFKQILFLNTLSFLFIRITEIVTELIFGQHEMITLLKSYEKYIELKIEVYALCIDQIFVQDE